MWGGGVAQLRWCLLQGGRRRNLHHLSSVPFDWFDFPPWPSRLPLADAPSHGGHVGWVGAAFNEELSSELRGGTSTFTPTNTRWVKIGEFCWSEAQQEVLVTTCLLLQQTPLKTVH